MQKGQVKLEEAARRGRGRGIGTENRKKGDNAAEVGRRARGGNGSGVETSAGS